MAIGHLGIRTMTRGRGHSAAATLAYRFGVRLRDARTGELHDYRRRSDVLQTGIESSRSTPLARSAQDLADGIERAERRGDARILRDIQIALPCEIDERARCELTRRLAVWLALRYDTPVAWAVHNPDPKGDPRNRHAHLALPTRKLDPSGQEFGKKLRVLDQKTTSGEEVASIRNTFADLANEVLERAGLESRVRVGRRLDDEPAVTLGPTVTSMERRAAERRGEELRGVSAAALVAGGECVTEVGHRAARQHRERLGTEPRYEPRARSRRSRYVEQRIQERDPMLVEALAPDRPQPLTTGLAQRIMAEPDSTPEPTRRRRRRPPRDRMPPVTPAAEREAATSAQLTPPTRKRRRRVRRSDIQAVTPDPEARPTPVPPLSERARMLVELTPEAVEHLGVILIHQDAGTEPPALPKLRLLQSRPARVAAAQVVKRRVHPY